MKQGFDDGLFQEGSGTLADVSDQDTDDDDDDVDDDDDWDDLEEDGGYDWDPDRQH